jgi:hypothetical protein
MIGSDQTRRSRYRRANPRPDAPRSLMADEERTFVVAIRVLAHFTSCDDRRWPASR